MRRAVILAAGNGDRFHSNTSASKLLAPVAGMSLISRTIFTAAQAGVRLIDIVVGYQAGAVQRAAAPAVPPGVTLRFHHNARWHEENGVSALVARPHIGNERFSSAPAV